MAIAVTGFTGRIANLIYYKMKGKTKYMLRNLQDINGKPDCDGRFNGVQDH